MTVITNGGTRQYSADATAAKTRTVTRIAVFRALKLGDFIVATPAFRAIRAAYPDAHIDYIGLPSTRELAKRYNHYFDGFIAFSGYPGLPELPWDRPAVARFLQDMQARHYDLVFQLHGNGSITNTLVALFEPEHIVGLARHDAYRPSNGRFVAFPETTPEPERLTSLLQHCGIGLQGTNPDFPILPSDEIELRQLPEYRLLGEQYVVLHSGAASSVPWSAADFATVADVLAGHGYGIVLTGTDNEQPIVQAVLRSMRRRTFAFDFSGKTTLGCAAALIRHAKLFIGNDTGTSHIAVAVGTPSIRIFTTSDPQRWAPTDTNQHPGIARKDASTEHVARTAETLLRKGMFDERNR